MDIARLITMVQEYEELYILRHPQYSNQQRRDNIWEEIGRRLNQTGKACKERWTRVRDNHRKALILRKTKSGQAGSKLKPPKFNKELTFLIPYLNDGEERRSNLSPVSDDNDLEEVQHDTYFDQNLPNVDNIEILVSSDTQGSVSASSVNSSQRGKRKSKRAASQGPSTASVLQDYLSKMEAANSRNSLDPLTEFFLNMAKTVSTFPTQDQVTIKAQLFQIVNRIEMRLAVPSPSLVSNVTLPPPPVSNESHRPVCVIKETFSPSHLCQDSSLGNIDLSSTQDTEFINLHEYLYLKKKKLFVKTASYK